LQTKGFQCSVQRPRIGAEETALIGAWLQAHPTWNRTRLSRELCLLWNWRNHAGRLKDMACRGLLLKLQAQGRIELPPRRTPSVNGLRNRRIGEMPHAQSPIQGDLEGLNPLQMEPLLEGSAAVGLFRFLLQRYHYLGLGNVAGQNLKYLVRDRRDRPLACLLFGSAAWQIRPRDQWIGWDAEQRRRHLDLLTNNTRFLILPWVRMPHLATHLLGQLTARLSADWQRKYGHPLSLVETFVEPGRFQASGYRAAGWLCVGLTTGRSRNDSDFQLQVPTKEIYLQPLLPDFRRRLAA
jgi:hypothetical protein